MGFLGVVPEGCLGPSGLLRYKPEKRPHLNYLHLNQIKGK